MKVGDLVTHPSLQGTGVVISVRPFDWKVARVLWTAHGKTEVHELATRYLEVANESR